MVHSRWHWCFNAYLFVHESSDTRRTVSLLDLVVLFVLEMEGLSCSVPGRAPARSSDMLPSATSVLCLWWTGADLDCVLATHKQALTFPSCVLCLPWFEPPFYLCLENANWQIFSVKMKPGFIHDGSALCPLSSLCVCLELDLHTKM